METAWIRMPAAGAGKSGRVMADATAPDARNKSTNFNGQERIFIR